MSVADGEGDERLRPGSGLRVVFMPTRPWIRLREGKRM
jgi:hypothetical protein